jgi:serine/threonine-protein kinase
MSPEQIRSQPPDARSDIYSLGATFYEMVTGQPAIKGDSEYSLMNAQLNHTPAAPADMAATIPRAVSDAIMRAMEKDPARRFQSAREFQSVLRGAETLPLAARTAPPASAIPAEDLARIEARLSRVLGPIARRLVADAARQRSSVAELCEGLGQFIADAAEREAFLQSCNKGTATVAPAVLPAPSAPRIWDPDLLANASQALAAYVGPIAKMVVNRAAKNARSEDELYAKLASEIPEEADRKRFTAALRKK